MHWSSSKVRSIRRCEIRQVIDTANRLIGVRANVSNIQTLSGTRFDTLQKLIQIAYTQCPACPSRDTGIVCCHEVSFFPIDPTRTYNTSLGLRSCCQCEPCAQVTPEHFHVDFTATDAAQNMSDRAVVIAPYAAVRVLARKKDASCALGEGRKVFGKYRGYKVCEGSWSVSCG